MRNSFIHKTMNNQEMRDYIYECTKTATGELREEERELKKRTTVLNHKLIKSL